MKKILGVIILGLLLSGCASPVGKSNNLLKDNEFEAVVHMQPDSDSVIDVTTTAFINLNCKKII